MPSFDQLLRRITPRHSVPAVPAAPVAPVAPVAVAVPVITEPTPVEEPGYFRQALIEARVRWARDVARASAATERVVFTDQYVPPPPKRLSSDTDAVGWWD